MFYKTTALLKFHAEMFKKMVLLNEKQINKEKSRQNCHGRYKQ
jgi:hypothetical protein